MGYYKPISLEGNSITDIHPNTFRNNRRLKYLYIWRNQITTIYTETFIYIADSLSFDFGRNSITYIGASAFRSNSWLRILNTSVNNITSIDSDTFSYNKQLQSLELQNNSISDIHVTTFRYNSRLRRLDISGNSIAHFNPFQPRDAIWHHAFHLFLICMPFAHWLQ